MLKLMKYELRKTMFSKFILLLITALVEAAYLIGVFFNWERGLAIGLAGLMCCIMFGILYIGIESLLVFHRDLNTKQSYMLFLTPTNSYQVLGAKVIENGVSILLTGAFFAALVALDFTVSVLYIGGVKQLLDMLHDMMIHLRVDINISAQSLALGFFTILVSWLMMVVTGYLAITLSATVLAGKRFSGVVSFIIYLLLGWACGWIVDKCVPVSMVNETLQYVLTIGALFIEIVVMYLAAGWIMERRLSV